MKKVFVFLAVMVLSISSGFGQNPIEVRKIGKNNQYYQNDQLLKHKQLLNIMQSNQEALDIYKKASSTSIFGLVLAGAGGGMIGWTIGTLLTDEFDTNWAIAGIGAGLIVVSIPIVKSAGKRVSNAVDIYNNGLSANSGSNNLELNCTFTGNGLGLVLNF